MKNKKKILVTTRGQLEALKLMLTADEFYSKFELSMDLVSTLCARKMLAGLATTDRAMTADEVKTLPN